MDTANQPKDEATLQEMTMQWINGWKTSPEQPFNINQVAYLYKQDDKLFSYDFGGITAGVLG